VEEKQSTQVVTHLAVVTSERRTTALLAAPLDLKALVAAQVAPHALVSVVTRSVTSVIPVIRTFVKHPPVERAHLRGLAALTTVGRRRATDVTSALAPRATDPRPHVPGVTIVVPLAY
jgi:hypothetical protein